MRGVMGGFKRRWKPATMTCLPRPRPKRQPPKQPHLNHLLQPHTTTLISALAHSMGNQSTASCLYSTIHHELLLPLPPINRLPTPSANHVTRPAHRQTPASATNDQEESKNGDCGIVWGGGSE